MKTIKTPRELLEDQIRDLYSVEGQVSQTMPELAARSPDPALRDFLAAQGEISLGQKVRLRQAAASLSSTPEGDECKAMKGLIKGGDEHIEQAEGPEVTGLILIAHVNRIIHYQIAGYGFATALAKRLALSDPDELLSTSLDEEKEAAQTLAALSVRVFATMDQGGPP